MNLLNRERGFTLIELMVSLVIFSIGVVLVLRAFLSVERTFSTSENIVRASLFIDEKMASLEEAAVVNNGTNATSEQGYFSDGRRTFNWDLNIEPFQRGEEEEEIENLLKASLNVSWQQSGQKRGLESISYYPAFVEDQEE